MRRFIHTADIHLDNLEVARYVKLAERTVYWLAAAKKSPGFKVCGAWRFSRADIDQWRGYAVIGQ